MERNHSSLGHALPPSPTPPRPKGMGDVQEQGFPTRERRAPSVPRASDSSPPASSLGHYGWISCGVDSARLQMSCDLPSKGQEGRQQRSNC